MFDHNHKISTSGLDDSSQISLLSSGIRNATNFRAFLAGKLFESFQSSIKFLIIWALQERLSNICFVTRDTARVAFESNQFCLCAVFGRKRYLWSRFTRIDSPFQSILFPIHLFALAKKNKKRWCVRIHSGTSVSPQVFFSRERSSMCQCWSRWVCETLKHL